MFGDLLKNIVVGVVGTVISDNTTAVESNTIIDTTKEIIERVTK